jgi:hypothetical protein
MAKGEVPFRALSRRTALASSLVLGASGCAGGLSGQAPDPPASASLYDMSARLEPDMRRMDVSGLARLPPSPSPRTELKFILAPAASNVVFECSDRDGANPIAVSTRTLPNGDLEWTLRPERQIAGSVDVRFSYRIEGTGLLFYMGPEVCLAAAWGMNWYPLSLADGMGMAIGSLQVQAPRGWKSVGSHRAVSTAEEEANGLFRFEVVHATYFSFASGPFVITEQPGAPQVKIYALGEREHAASMAEGTQRMMGVLAREFGPYRFGTLSLVEVPRPLAQSAGFNGASLAGFAVLNSNAFRAPGVGGMLEWLAHELSHQWFPHTVWLNIPHNLLLVEALAEYGGWRAVEEMGGEAAAEQMRRVGFAPDPIYSAAAYFRIVATGGDSALTRPGDSPSEPVARNVAYNKGAFFYYMLAQHIGVEKFRRALHALTAQHAHGRASWDDFKRAVELESRQDLTWFFEQWLNREGAPDFELSWRQEGDAVAGVIRQPEPYYAARIEVRADGADGQRLTEVVEVAAAAETGFSLRPGFAARDVVLDPAYKILRWTPEYRAMQ